MKKYILFFFLICAPYVARAEKVMTFTITSKTTVGEAGDVPIGVQASYYQTGTTGQKGQMTAGNSTTFILSGLQNLQINRIDISMRSNKAAGAGSLNMTINDQTLWGIGDAPFYSDTWNGAYTTEYVNISYVPILPLEILKKSELMIQIAASENSLYVQSYTIYYTPLAPRAATVHFHTGTDEEIASITETAPNSGITLPDCPDADSTWRFVAWIEEPVTSTQNTALLPTRYEPQTKYYPNGETTLYALYADKELEEQLWTQDTTFESGEYIIYDSIFQVIPCGVVGETKSGKINVVQMTLGTDTQGRHIFPQNNYIADAIYALYFVNDSLLTIQHLLSQTYVGAPKNIGDGLRKEETQWRYMINDHRELIIYQIYNDDWVQFRANASDMNIYFQPYKTPYITHGLTLFNLMDMPTEIIVNFTSYPFGTALSNILPEGVRVTSQAVLNNSGLLITLYTLHGVPLYTTSEDISLLNFPKGIYLLKVNNIVYKISC